MELEKSDYLSILLLVLIAGITVYGFTQIQGDMAVHFDSTGQPDNEMAKLPGLLMIPGLAIGFLILFQFLPRIDPLGDSYKDFEAAYHGFKVFMIGLLGYVQLLLVLWNTGFRFDMTQFIVPVVASAYYAAGIVMERAERNWFIGFRTPWTLSSDEVWKKTHEKFAPLMKLAGVLALGGLVVPEYAIYFFAVPAVVIALGGTVYSYLAYRQTQ